MRLRTWEKPFNGAGILVMAVQLRSFGENIVQGDGEYSATRSRRGNSAPATTAMSAAGWGCSLHAHPYTFAEGPDICEIGLFTIRQYAVKSQVA